MASLQRINIGQRSIHNPLASQRSKAADPRINALTLSRLSYSRDKDVRNICAENLRDRLERAAISPYLLPLFNEQIIARAISYSHMDKMPDNKRADKLCATVAQFLMACRTDTLKYVAATAEDHYLLGLIATSRIPEDQPGLCAFAIIALRNNPFAKIAFQRIVTFWSDLDDNGLRVFAEKAAKPAVKEAAAYELRRRSGVGG